METSVLACGFGLRAPIFAISAKLFRFNLFTLPRSWARFLFTNVDARLPA